MTARSLLALALLAGASALPLAAEAARLKADVSVAAAVVTLGDLIEGAGAAGNVPVFRAPDPGTTGDVPAASIRALAREHGVQDLESAGFESVAVRRLSRTIEAEAIEHALREALADALDIADARFLAIDLERRPPDLVLAADAGAVVVDGIEIARRSGRFVARLSVPGAGPAGRLALTGAAYETIYRQALLRDVRRGEVIGAGDVELRTVRRRGRAEDALGAPEALVGMAARRSMSAGQLPGPRDFEAPQIVERGQGVTMVYHSAGMNLTVKATALQDGAKGEIINVVNLQSNRTLQGTVIAPGRVEVGGANRTRLSALAGGGGS